MAAIDRGHWRQPCGRFPLHAVLLLPGHNVVDQHQFQGALGVYEIAGEQYLEGDISRQNLGRSAGPLTEGECHVSPGASRIGLGGSNPDVASQGDAAALGQTDSVYGGDDRLPDVGLHDVQVAGAGALVGPGVGHSHQIVAGGEGPSLTGYDGAPYLRVVLYVWKASQRIWRISGLMAFNFSGRLSVI